MSVSRKAVLRIEKENIIPRPRWHFTTRDILLWIIGIICTLLGALAFAVCIFSMREGDFHLFDHLRHSLVEFLLVLLPSFWALWFLVLIGVAIRSVRLTKKGYRFKSWKILIIILFLNITGGAIFYSFGGAQILRESFAARPTLQSLLDLNKRVIWSRPEHGTLSGEVLNAEKDGTMIHITLRDFDGKEWQIEGEAPYIYPTLRLMPGEVIRILGKKTAENFFIARELHPWAGHMHHGKEMP